MSDLICRKTMMRCQTPGMCSPYGGCQLQPVTESVFKAGHAALIEQAKSAPAEPDAELVELLGSLLTVIDSNGYAADEVEIVDELRALLNGSRSCT